MATREIWKPIPGYLNYKVSNLGRVKSIGENGMVLRPIRDTGGYLKVNLSEGGRRQEWKIHKAVMTAFVGERPRGLQVNHIDEDKTNNCLSNLEYVTPKRNANHGTRNARISKAVSGIKRSPESRRRIKQAAAKRRRPVQCIETGFIYETASMADRAIGLTQGVRHVCLGIQKTAGGYHWRYVQ